MNGQAKRPDDELTEATDAEMDVSGAGTPAAGDVTSDPAEAALAEAQAKASENWERYLRAAAEAENTRKRAARDIEKAHKFALEQFGKELLAVRDTLELGLASADSASIESLLEGSSATLKLLTTTMERFGIAVVDPAGEPFDPEFHEAISVQPSESVEPGSVLTVVQKGYSLNGRLLRPALVVVAEK